ncbi:MAG: histidine phosphatase family protein [Bacteroidetes bacterium]|nr:histidine phosphatase family protein [Bacteroidota bacterium]
MLSVYLLRHGQTPYNADGNRYCGHTDIGLTERGIRQALAVHERLRGVRLDAVYSSPLLRARRTAELASGWDTVQTDHRLIEIDFGSWEHKTREEFVSADPSSWEAWSRDPLNNRAGNTGESGAEIVARLDDFFNEMLVRHAGQTILAVGHNGVNRLYMAHKLGMPLQHYRRIVQENSAVTLFELDDNGAFTLHRLNA